MYEKKTEMEDTLYGREKKRDSGMAVLGERIIGIINCLSFY